MCRGSDEWAPPRLLTLDVPLRRDALAQPWCGVNLGGWLLLEPGPSAGLFEQHAPGGEVVCEWDLMEVLRQKGATDEISRHRDTFMGRSDFERIRTCGLNAVRLPIGYWVVLGPEPGAPYVGPAMHYVDMAVQWAEELGLQVVLDLHGCPGGESGETPCGRRQRPHGTWHWSSWLFGKSLQALGVLAERYRGRATITGIQVCNEPSNTVPLQQLCSYYDAAVDVVRGAGMPAESVAVVLPVFQRSVEEFAAAWQVQTQGRHANICFDLHYYHCFENLWNGKTLAEQLRAVEAHVDELRRFPAVVGEWSLALGLAARRGVLSCPEARAVFGRAQLAAYAESSHGWFFWNWRDGAGADWDWQLGRSEGALAGPPPTLPAWDGLGDDPLEELFDPSPAVAYLCMGDLVRLRAYHGRYVSAAGNRVRASACSADASCVFRLCPAADANEAPTAAADTLVSGSVVRLLAQSGKCLCIDGDRVLAAPDSLDGPATEFVLHMGSSGALRHRSTVFLQSRESGMMLDVDGGSASEQVQARWEDCSDWQRFVLEKTDTALATLVLTDVPSPLKRRSLAVPSTPAKRRRSSTSCALRLTCPSTPQKLLNCCNAGAPPAASPSLWRRRSLRRRSLRPVPPNFCGA